MAVTQYIGSRYVPLFADPAEWSSTKTYEPLTIVLHQGNSFTSKQFVPVGIDIANTDFWAETGNYNAQVERYRLEVQRFTSSISAKPFAFETVEQMQRASNVLYEGAICHTNGYYQSGDGGAGWYVVGSNVTPNDMDIINCAPYAAQLIYDNINPTMFGAHGDGLNDDTRFVRRCIEVATDCIELVGLYKLTSTIDVTNNISIVGSNTVGRYKDSTSDPYIGFKTGFIIAHEGVGVRITKAGAYGQVFKGGTYKGFGIKPDTYLHNDAVTGIEVNAESHLVFDTLSFNQFNAGVGMLFHNGGQYINVSDCIFDDCLYGIKVDTVSGDTVDFFSGCNIINCYFDGNSNGTLFNSNPREGAYGIYLGKTGNWYISSCRFQGLEYCIYCSNRTTSNISIALCRFEMFTYGIYAAGNNANICGGNSFDGYLGDTTRTKVAIYIAETANYTKISGYQNTTSLNYLPIKDYGGQTVRNDILHVTAQCKELSAGSTYIPIAIAPYRGIVSNMRLYTGQLDANYFGNDIDNYWSFIPSGYNAADDINTIGKQWGASRYDKLQIVEKRNDSNGTHGVNAGNPIYLYVGKHGAPTTITDLTVELDFLPLGVY